MKCPEVQKLIEDYGYGELNPKLMQEVEAHLAVCGGCSRLREALRSEEKTYQDYAEALDGSLEIAPSMWDRISGELSADGKIHAKDLHRKEFSTWFFDFSKLLPGSAITRQILFASILVLISVGSTLLILNYVHQRQVVVENVPSQDLKEKNLQNALLSIQRAEKEYIKAIRMLSSIVDERKSTLDPRMVAELEKNLKAIDEVIASTRRAYRDHPTDPELAHYMLTAYQKKVELLQDLALTIS